MIAYRFGPEDLGRVRFAISPLFEIAASLDVLRDPARHAMHAPWVRAARERLRGPRPVAARGRRAARAGYRPDFVHPPPERPRAGFASELARVRATPPEQVARDLGVGLRRTRRCRPPRAVLLDDPPRGLRAAHRADDRVLAAARSSRAWPAIRAALEADIAYRAGRLAAGGPLAAFADLHEEVALARTARCGSTARTTSTVELAGRGLLLVPVAFAWPQLWAMIDPPWQPAVVYAPRGVATLWAPEERPADALADLLGRRRAAILAGLPADHARARPRATPPAPPASPSTSPSCAAPAWSRGRREGRSVRYARTPAGDALVAAAGDR